MTASAPSYTAVATSEASARVGVGAVIIDSSIWVATMTGFPANRQAWMICFCTLGTSSGGISTPRSPRATIKASARSMISSRRRIAAGFSSLTMSPATLPSRNFGPCRSARMPIGRPTSASTARISSNRARCSSCVPWLKFSRNTSTPASNSARSRSPPELAGPIVATILALRIRRSGLLRPRRRSAVLLAVEDEDGTEIIDIRQGRAGHLKIAERGKKARGIIPGERLFDGGATRGGAGDRVRVNNRAGIVLGSVDPVSVAGERIDAAAAPGVFGGIFGQRGGKRQQEFAVAPPAPLALDRDSGLAARQ